MVKLNKAATIESKLVSMTRNHETLEGKIDLEKVKDIRKAIRRRYSTRRKIHKIFKTWDRHNKGHITINDVHTMLNDLGHKVNFDEARLLLASADTSGDNKLTLDEFLVLVYSDK